MPGAWEQLPSVLVGILHTEIVPIAWAFGYRNLIFPSQSAVMPVAGKPFDDARNCLAMKALDIGADFLFMLDSDVIPPPDVILRLMKHSLPIVSGVYFRRSPPHGKPVAMKPVGRWVDPLPEKGLLEVDVVGAGCLLIKKEVLKALPPIDPEMGRHWFSWRVDRQGMLPPGEAVSEDFAFNLHAKKHGFPTYLDCSIRCRHIGLSEASENSLRPCEVVA